MNRYYRNMPSSIITIFPIINTANNHFSLTENYKSRYKPVFWGEYKMTRCLFFYVLFGLFSLSTNLNARDVLVEGKAAYFAPTDNKFRKIYSGGGIYGGEITVNLYDNLSGWLSADYFIKDGSSIGEHDSTRITLIPIGIGLKYFIPINCADLYIGAGALGISVDMKDRSPFVIHHISKWGLGGIAKAGALFYIAEELFADLFTSYTYSELGFHQTDHGRVTRRHANLSGWSFGIGIGYRFGCPK